MLLGWGYFASNTPPNHYTTPDLVKNTYWISISFFVCFFLIFFNNFGEFHLFVFPQWTLMAVKSIRGIYEGLTTFKGDRFLECI